MKLSIKTSENARFEIEKDTPKDNIVSSILSCIDKLKGIRNEERETIQSSLSDTLSYNIKLDTGKEINLKETKENVCLKLSSVSYEDRLKETAKNAIDLLDIKDKDERRNLVLNSTPYQLSDMIRIPDRSENPIKTEISMMIDESKYDSKDAFHAPEISGYAIRSMSLNEVSQLFDCKDVLSLGKYEKICFFPASNVYMDRSKELFGDGDDKLTIKFEIRSSEVYNHLSVGQYDVSTYEWGSDLRQEPCLDILKEEKGAIRTVLSPEYHLPHYNIGELVPVEINGKDVSCMTVADISDYIKNIPSYDYFGYDDMDMGIDKDIDRGILGTGDVLKDMASKLESKLEDAKDESRIESESY